MKHYEELDKLLKEHFGNKQVVGVEIGTGGGAATVTILSALPNCFLYTIDPFEHREGEEFEASHPQEDHDRTKAQAEKRLLNFSDRSKLLVMKSRDAISFVPKEVDLIWIDGDHSENGITTDIDLYYPLVKQGGIFGGHDFGQVHPLTEIIQERFEGKINTGGDFTFWIFK
jgi:predicted O-methyltransferase YrrM